MKLQLGRKGIDKITGFSGIITARIIYLTGCPQVQLTPDKLKNDEIPTSSWLDESRVEYVGDNMIDVFNITNMDEAILGITTEL